MKNVKKLLKKAMVFAVAASMLVGTPLTASAAGIRGVYSISDGTGQLGENPDASHTGTVTNTDTNSNSGVIKDNDASIMGIVLDKDYVNAEKGKQVDLTATIVIEGDLVEKDGWKDDGTEEKIRKELASKIKWEVLNSDHEIDANTNKILSISASASDRTKVTLNPRKGTKLGEEMIVRATIDGSYRWIINGEGELEQEKLTTNKTKDYVAEAKVFIKEYSDTLELINMPDEDKVFTKHTIKLNTDEHLKRVPETANDTITWISTNTKAATVTAAGVVTFKTVNQTGSIIAVGERGAKAEWKFKVSAGTPASKVEILDDEKNPAEPFVKNTTTVDLNSDIEDDWNGNTKDVTVRMYAKVKNVVVSEDNAKQPALTLEDAKKKNGNLVTATLELPQDTEYYTPDGDDKTKFSSDKPQTVDVTDVIDWSSNKTAFAEVDADNTDSDDATLTAKGVGTATITAKASGGKKATLKVVVKATLGELTITNNNDEPLYSGQSIQMTYTRKPEESKDAVAWSIAKVKVLKNGVEKEVKNPNATINAKGVLTIKPKLDLSEEAYQSVTVVLQSKKKLANGEKDADGKDVTAYVTDDITFKLEQSSIDGIRVKEGDKLIAEVHTEYKNGKASVKTNTELVDKKNDNVTTINVPKDKVYDVSIIESALNYHGGTDTLTWKTSNASIADFVNYGDTVKIEAKKKGTVTMTVSGIRAEDKDGKLNKASVIKTTFKVNVLQPVNTITLNKPSVVLNRKVKNQKVNGETIEVTQPQNVALKATLGPKGVDTKTAVNWTVEKVKGAEDGTAAPADKNGNLITKASVTVKLEKPEIGDEYKITAWTKSGASATATVKIVTKTTSVAIAKSSKLTDATEAAKPAPQLFTTPKGSKEVANTLSMKLGDDPVQMYPFVNIGKSTKALEVDWKDAGTETYEGVEYTVNKKGVVNIIDGKIYAVNSGTVTITAKTPLGKKATLKVTVEKPVVPTAN